MAIRTAHRLIRTEIPAPGTDEVLDRLSRVQPRSSASSLPIVWDSAHGHTVTDIAGNQFIDFTSGIFVASVGHSSRAVVDALVCSLDVNRMHSYSYATEIRAQYLEALTKWSGFEKAFLLSAGTEATEAALKIMRLHGEKTGRRKILCLPGAFHGKTMGAAFMSDAGMVDENFHRIPWADCVFPQDSCGVMIESCGGWSARFHPTGRILQIAALCKQFDMIICFDEMQTGFARTGRKFGFEHYGVTPDLVCVGKGMGGGFPVSGVLGRADLLDLPDDLSSTHSANPLACAAGLAVLEEIDRWHLVEEAERKGDKLKVELEKCGFPVFGKGLLMAVHMPTERSSAVCRRCMENGLLVVHTGRESVKIGPPLTISDEAMMEGAQVLLDAIRETA